MKPHEKWISFTLFKKKQKKTRFDLEVLIKRYKRQHHLIDVYWPPDCRSIILMLNL